MMKSRSVLFILLFGLSTTFCALLAPDSSQEELRIAFEQSREALAEARFTLDTSHLSDVFTEDRLSDIVKEIESLSNSEDATLRAEEIEVDWVEVEEYNPPIAVIKVKYFYRAYTYNRNTGMITYDSEPQRFWRIVEYQMVLENEKWKVDKALGFIDWSG